MADFYTRFCFAVPFASTAEAKAARLTLARLAEAISEAVEEGDTYTHPLLGELGEDEFTSSPEVSFRGDTVYIADDGGCTSAVAGAAYARLLLHQPGCSVDAVRFEWANTASRSMPDAFSGGACVVVKGGFVMAHTSSLLDELADEAAAFA